MTYMSAAVINLYEHLFTKKTSNNVLMYLVIDS